MQGIGWISALIVGGLAGWAASWIMNAQTSLLTNIVLGIIGALVANFGLGLLGIAASPTWLSQGVVGLAGACALIWGWRKTKG